MATFHRRPHYRIWEILVGCVVLFSAIILGFMPLARAATPSPAKPRGLSIAPIRQFMSMDAGSTKTAKITVGNYTTKPLAVSFNAKAFSVNDYSYDFQFNNAPANQITFDTDEITLRPNQSQSISYHITIPANGSPGGQYYTLFATGADVSGTSKQEVQTTSLVYLTVNGDLTHTSRLQAAEIAHFSFSPNIPFSLDISNTGNVHYYVFINARLSGPFVTDSTSTETHLLLPGKARHFQSFVRAPLMPGIYTATFGYSTDYQPSVLQTARVLYVPPWFVAALVVIAWAIWMIARRHKRRRAAPTGAANDTSGDTI